MKRLLSIAVFTAAMTAWLAANAGKPAPEAQYSQIHGSFTAWFWNSSYYPPQKDYLKASINVRLMQDGSASGTITVGAFKYTAASWSLLVESNNILVQTTAGMGFLFYIGGGGPGCTWPDGMPVAGGGVCVIEHGGYTVK